MKSQSTVFLLLINNKKKLVIFQRQWQIDTKDNEFVSKSVNTNCGVLGVFQISSNHQKIFNFLNRKKFKKIIKHQVIPSYFVHQK